MRRMENFDIKIALRSTNVICDLLNRKKKESNKMYIGETEIL